MADSSEINRTITTLQELAKNPDALAALSQEQRLALMKVAGHISRPDKIEILKEEVYYKELYI